MRCRAVVAIGVMLVGGVLAAQQIGDLQAGRQGAAHVGYVSYAAEPAMVLAGRRSVVEVRLRVADGFHVNSHTPKSELLIPTMATLAGDAETMVGAVEYPAGTTYSLAADPGTKLDVYTGPVVLRVPVTAAAGEHVLRGSLRYQACDRAACYPPKTLALEVPFTAK